MLKTFDRSIATVLTRHFLTAHYRWAPLPLWKREALFVADWTSTRTFDAVIVPSTVSRSDAVTAGMRSARLLEIPLGLDFDRVKRVDESRVAAFRRQLTPDGSPLVVSIGRLVWEKDLDVLLRAWTAVLGVIPEARLAIAGDGPLYQRLQQMTTELGLKTRVTLLGQVDDVNALIRAADVVAQPSRFESTGLVYLEALSLEVPVVTTRVGIVGQYLQHQVHCLVVPHGDDVAMARAITQLIRDRGLGERLAAAGAKVVTHEFSATDMVRRYASLYQRLVSRDWPSRHQDS